jgi:serine/threonine-protein kinase
MTSASIPPPVEHDADWLVSALCEARVIDPGLARQQLAEFLSENPNAQARGFAQILVEMELLTPYQAEQALAGQADKLVLGPYLLQSPLGSGSLGTVFLARHRGDRQQYAVKVLPLRSLWKVLRAKKLVAAMAALPKHPVIVPFREIDTAKGFHYLAWPYVEGETLENRVARQGPMTVKQACQFFADLGGALAICHQSGIVHGSIRPTQLLVAPDQTPRLLDLGMGAILVDNLDDEHSILDTISSSTAAMDQMDYAPPETIHDPTVRTPASDLYAWSACLHFALCGEPPFPGGNVVDKMMAHQTQAPPALHKRDPNIPAALSDLVLKGLAKSASERPSNWPEICEQLRHVAAQEPEAAVPHEAQVDLDSPLSMRIRDLMEKIDHCETLAHQSTSEKSMASAESLAASNRTATPSLIDFNLDPPESWSIGRMSHAMRSLSSEVPKIEEEPQILVLPETTPELANPTPQPLPKRTQPPVSERPSKPSGKTLPAPVQPPLVELPPTPVSWEAGSRKSDVRYQRPEVRVPPVPVFGNTLSRAASRLLRTFQGASDVVQFSIFGPPEVTPGQRFELLVYAHPPTAFRSVTTLCRALRQDTELLGAGYADRMIARGSTVGLHLAIGNAGLAKSLLQISWIGQTQPRTFEVFVPWESPAGVTQGVLTVGVQNVQSGSVTLHFVVLPRTTE